MEPSNLFDHGKSSQFKVIKPFMKKIREYVANHNIDSDFRNFFMDQLNSCIAMISEHEDRPKWVNNIDSYRMKSEIVVFISLFDCIEPSEEPTNDEKEEISYLYNSVRDLGKERDWDLQILHLQFLRAMGNAIQNYIIQIIIPRKLKPIDYN